MEKKCKKAKWLSGETLQIAVKRREAKSKREKERYKHLNAEFQRIARRDKKAFLSDQCKEIEANNRMGKTRDLFKKIRVTKGTFHAKMGSIKDRNGMDITEAEAIKKRWQEYTEELYKKNLHDPDNHNDVITDLELRHIIFSYILPISLHEKKFKSRYIVFFTQLFFPALKTKYLGRFCPGVFTEHVEKGCYCIMPHLVAKKIYSASSLFFFSLCNRFSVF